MINLVVFLIAALWIFPSAIAFILLLLHRTHFVVEYGSLFGLSKFVKRDEFLAWEQENPDVGYFVFLEQSHSNFFTRLLRCPWCLGTWLSFLSSFPVSYYATKFTTTCGAVLFGWAWAYSAGFVALFLYFLMIFVYKLAFRVEKS